MVKFTFLTLALANAASAKIIIDKANFLGQQVALPNGLVEARKELEETFTAADGSNERSAGVVSYYNYCNFPLFAYRQDRTFSKLATIGPREAMITDFEEEPNTGSVTFRFTRDENLDNDAGSIFVSYRSEMGQRGMFIHAQAYSVLGSPLPRGENMTLNTAVSLSCSDAVGSFALMGQHVKGRMECEGNERALISGTMTLSTGFCVQGGFEPSIRLNNETRQLTTGPGVRQTVIRDGDGRDDRNDDRDQNRGRNRDQENRDRNRDQEHRDRQREQENRDRNRDRNQQDRNQQDRNQQDRNQQDRNQQDRNQQDRNQQNRDQQNHDQRNRDMFRDRTGQGSQQQQNQQGNTGNTGNAGNTGGQTQQQKMQQDQIKQQQEQIQRQQKMQQEQMQGMPQMQQEQQAAKPIPMPTTQPEAQKQQAAAQPLPVIVQRPGMMPAAQ
ncbi:hypothetical protein VHEMI07242 [[Torrubiella] hemipterigena]|uniref:Uncharacterized protein n=1 Tax=[Torrubiella] hemipterigena TaxID=1531966 RepID=A0A0A1TL06_9HYPO|nr:hypothetical protein VHEMI07242 [[Torrubiella] hemipterigena]